MKRVGRRIPNLLHEKALVLAPEGQPFILPSGKTSNLYVDMKRVLLNGGGLYTVVQRLHHHLRSVETKFVAGVALGGYPLATGVSLFSYALAKEAHRQVPVYDVLYVRKEAHGMGQLVEGTFEPGDTVALLEDVVTTGASSLRAIDALRAAGLVVVHVFAVLDREDGGAEALEAAGVPFEALAYISDLHP